MSVLKKVIADYKSSISIGVLFLAKWKVCQRGTFPVWFSIVVFSKEFTKSICWDSIRLVTQSLPYFDKTHFGKNVHKHNEQYLMEK